MRLVPAVPIVPRAAGTAALLPRNTALPFSAERTFYTMRPGETQIIIPVFEGETTDPDLCRRVGTVVIDGLPPGRPANQPVSVTMSLNRNAILQVAAGRPNAQVGSLPRRAGPPESGPARRGRPRSTAAGA